MVQAITSVGTGVVLLTGVFIPALIGLRDRNIQAVCTTRIGLLTRAMLVYASDYDETPPFLGRGWEDTVDADQDSLVWPALPGETRTVADWKALEDWLMPDMPFYWCSAQSDWPNQARVTHGSLYPYTRSDQLYRCPAFERAVGKSQNAFNYSRTLLGRTWYHRGEPGGANDSPWFSGNWAGACGPIMRLSTVYVPARLYMMVDERWNRHVGAPPDQFSPPAQTGGGLLGGRINGGWMAADCMFFPMGDELGQYHGRPVRTTVPAGAQPFVPTVRQANLGFYDGHAGLSFDPLPDRNVDPAMGISNAVEVAVGYLNWVFAQLYAQRGVPPVVDMPF